MQNRVYWVDQVKGFAILLVVYGHNFPFSEQYIYTFHMPLFFMVSGFFFPKSKSADVLLKRSKTLMIPYFFWASFLFLFWLFIGRGFGKSADLELSVFNNFLGIFYSQGGAAYMDWGIPMWFLPCMLVTFALYFLLTKYLSGAVKYVLVLVLLMLGLGYPHLTNFHLPWSIHVAFVALFFMMIGHVAYPYISQIGIKKSLWLIPLLLATHFALYFYNAKIDMYRAGYGSNELVFVINALIGSFAVILLVKLLPYFKPLAVLGQYTILVLALQVLSISVIKFCIWKWTGNSEFNFSELEKVLYAVLQVLLIYPVYLIVNRYCPILNGTNK